MAKDGVRDKTAERQVNLVMLLQSDRRGFTKEQICERVDGYKNPESEAFNRMFERDKVELLAAGIEIEVFQPDPWDQNVFKYRVTRSAALLPDLTLNSAEVRILNLATVAWQGSIHSSAALDLRHKLATVGLETETEVPIAQVDVKVDLEPLIAAISVRKRVRFDYRKPKHSISEQREIEPWGIALRSRNWYLYGHDCQRGALRVFNLARVTSSFVAIRQANAYEIPDQVSASSILAREDLKTAHVQVTLHVEPGKGVFWRDRAAQIGENSLPFDEAGEIVVELQVPTLEIAQLAADAPGVVVLAPEEVRSHISSLLVGAHHG